MGYKQMFIYFVLLCTILGFSVGNPTTESFVVANKQEQSETKSGAQDTQNESSPPQLKSMNVTCHVRNRYARTVVNTRYANPRNIAQEVTFAIVLPKTAFITGFLMEIKGKEYKAYVREKEQAKQEYDQAVRSGQAAAHVAASVRDSSRFTISMNVEPFEKVTFKLTYEQLLVRKLGFYDLALNLHPGQLVKELSVDVYIDESKRIVSLQTPALRSGNKIQDQAKVKSNPFATSNILNADGTKAHIHFAPTKDQQIEMARELNLKDEMQGIAGQFVVQYDVQRDPQDGEVLVSNGYFVHFFAPSGLKPLPKHVVFVLDVSGSMAGKKLKQLKEAMLRILNELSEEDFFDIIKFSSTVQVLNRENSWEEVENPASFERPSAHAATAEVILQAKNVIRNLRHEGWTNIYDALQVGIKVAMFSTPDQKLTNDLTSPQPLLIFLTDGEANVGITNSEDIIRMVTSKNKRASVFTLAFGRSVEKNLLKGLAKRNHGFMRKIYEASDASLQLENFYKEISSPLLTDVHFKVADENVASVTKPMLPIMFRDSEIVIAGKTKSTSANFLEVEGKAKEGPKIFRPVTRMLPSMEMDEEYGSLERLWAYLTIKQLLEKKFEDDPKEDKNNNGTSAKQEALKLALEYSFVTPVTSLVVVKPNLTDSVYGEETSILRESLPDSAHNRGDTGGNGFKFLRTHKSYFARRSDTTPIDSSMDLKFISAPTVSDLSVLDYQPWIRDYYNSNQITIDNKTYMLKSNNSVEEKPCTIQTPGSTGTCTLLSNCQILYPKLDSLEIFKNYLCILENKYAGVCCTNKK